MPEPNRAFKAPTLCWTCRRTSCGLCPWFTDFSPVDGWTAGPTQIQVTGKAGFSKVLDSYNVRGCPLHDPEPAVQTDADDSILRNLAAAVVEQAVQDWRSLCRGGLETPERSFDELEDFFEHECGLFIRTETADRIYRALRQERGPECKGA